MLPTEKLLQKYPDVSVDLTNGRGNRELLDDKMGMGFKFQTGMGVGWEWE